MTLTTQIFFSTFLAFNIIFSIFSPSSFGMLSNQPHMLRSQTYQSPKKFNTQTGYWETPLHTQVGHDGITPELQPLSPSRSGVEFPGAPPKDSSPDEYATVRTAAPYGNHDYFKDIFQTPIAQFSPFSSQQRSLIILYNLIRNKGGLISDYHRASNGGLNQALSADGLTEDRLYLRLPQDLLVGGYIECSFLQWMKTLTPEQLQILNDHLHPQPLTLSTIKIWIQQNQNPHHPIAHLDHVHPQSKGGSNDLRNGVLCSADTNLAKSDHWLLHVNSYLAQPPSAANDLNPVSLSQVMRTFTVDELQ